ncbi:hypothetical protein [Persicobacter psychrovividus]|uniref:DUF4834 domain-containing protein n=1 Tax=Persicobacter psychrovividus TaxID=387638 RepID=A0ABN6LAG1_9BACT|nr:hypothetical protein PEPS_24710 [Persicobacter psychrovividus]
MGKFLIFLFILFYIGYKRNWGRKLLMFAFYKLLKKQGFQPHGAQQQYAQQNPHGKRRKPSGVHVDYVPDKKKKDIDPNNFKGGDYIDYQEVD